MKKGIKNNRSSLVGLYGLGAQCISRKCPTSPTKEINSNYKMIDKNKIPPSWAYISLTDELLYIKTGVTKYEGTKKYYSTGSIKDDAITSEGEYSFEKKPSRANRLANKGDVFQARMKNTDKAILTDSDFHGQLFSTGFFQLRADERIFNNKLIFYFLKSLNFKEIKDELCSGSTQVALNDEGARKIKIPIPPLPEQHRIVKKIEQLFTDLNKGIESLKTAQQQLKVYRQAVLKWAFEGKLTNKKIVDGELPKGWKLKKHFEIADINPKLPFENIDNETEVSFLPMKLVEEEKNKFHLTEFKKYKDAKKGFTPFTNGDIIFAKITPCMENGKCAVMHSLKNQIGFGSTEFHVSRPKENIVAEYIFYFIIQENFRREAAKHFTGSVGQKRVPTSFFSNFQIPVPSKEEQKKIILEIESRLSVCDKIEEIIINSLLQSEALRLSILKKAFEGKLVKQNPKDEPAEILLAKIKKMSELGKKGLKDDRIIKKKKKKVAI
ncbi:MAG: restriction endonuclease subunit S [Bacteroidota bacterium]